uniref:Gustatory receptor n=1 Tax=Glossina pallidipes TaxID=7398 RepID=A0A1B0AAM5_GLOPL
MGNEYLTILANFECYAIKILERNGTHYGRKEYNFCGYTLTLSNFEEKCDILFSFHESCRSFFCQHYFSGFMDDILQVFVAYLLRQIEIYKQFIKKVDVGRAYRNGEQELHWDSVPWAPNNPSRFMTRFVLPVPFRTDIICGWIGDLWCFTLEYQQAFFLLQYPRLWSNADDMAMTLGLLMLLIYEVRQLTHFYGHWFFVPLMVTTYPYSAATVMLLQFAYYVYKISERHQIINHFLDQINQDIDKTPKEITPEIFDVESELKITSSGNVQSNKRHIYHVVGGKSRLLDYIVFMYFIWSFVTMLVTYIVLRLCCNASGEAKQTAVIVQEIMRKRPAFMLGVDGNYNEMKSFLLQSLHWEEYFQYNAIGLFSLDYTLIFTMISAATSYLIVLLQVDISSILQTEGLL